MLRKMGNHVRVVSGKNGYALYNLEQGTVYHLNQEAYDVIQSYLSGIDIFDDDEQAIINILDEIKFTQDLLDHNITDIRPILTYAWLEITEACNLNCIHCYGEWGHPVLEPEKYLRYEEWTKIIDDIYDAGCRSIQFIGGEPLASSQFRSLLIYAHQKGMDHIDVFTNGTLINDDLIVLFQQFHVSVRVSVYGHNADVHDRISKHTGSFDKTISNIKKMQEKKIPVTLAVIIMQENEPYVKEIEDFISTFGSHGYDTIRQTTYGTQLKHAVKNAEILTPRYQSHPDFFVKKKMFDLNQHWNSCWFGKLAFTSKGDIIPCIFARECVMGNIRTDTQEQIRENVLHMWRITKDQIVGCQDCEYRYACHDCRPLAKGLTGDLLGKYPRCCYEPSIGTWKDIEDISLELDKNGSKD